MMHRGRLWLCVAAAVAGVTAAPACRDVNIPVSISATNIQLPDSLTLDSLISFLALGLEDVVDFPINGTYNIFGVYCTPEVHVAGRSDTLQLLVHGSARTHNYWHGYDFGGSPYHGANYSWAARASRVGYPTLAVDRIGNGNSSHPDPNTVVQLPANVEVTHALIQQVNAGFLGRKFSEVLYVGHSYGSLVGQVFVSKYPSDIKRLVLTGWTHISTKLLQTGTNPDSTGPANQIEPEKYGNLSSGYMISNTNTSTNASTYYGYGTSFAGEFYDPEIPVIAFEGRGTYTNGETYSEIFVPFPSPEFEGKVYAMTGQHDGEFCGNESMADCGTGPNNLVAQGSQYFPSAKSFDWYIAPNTSHEWNFHYSQNVSFGKIFDWITGTQDE